MPTVDGDHVHTCGQNGDLYCINRPDRRPRRGEELELAAPQAAIDAAVKTVYDLGVPLNLHCNCDGAIDSFLESRENACRICTLPKPAGFQASWSESDPMAGLIGHTFVHYRITAALGAGGMGEVYRATDTKLGRDVAIKVLPPEVAGDAERLGRFEREAQLLASLNHPNVAAIYGLEEADGKPFLALELVEGEDLSERLKRGEVPLDDALEIARQVAEGLEEAHEKGIVHRDLKPANIKLTPDGKVKVLDFGLAKAYSGDPATGSSAEPSQSPTLAHSGTQAGVILGTAAYMSPEQARGKPVDKRSDVWAFGVVLWEMLTGRKLFGGETVGDVLAAVLRAQIDLSGLPAETPVPVRRLIGRCLERDTKRRLRDIGEARIALDPALRTSEGTSEEAVPRGTGGCRGGPSLPPWPSWRRSPPPSPGSRGDRRPRTHLLP